MFYASLGFTTGRIQEIRFAVAAGENAQSLFGISGTNAFFLDGNDPSFHEHAPSQLTTLLPRDKVEFQA